MKGLDAAVELIVPDLVALRREFHRIPETAGEEVKTSALAAATLRSWGIETRTGVGGTGVVAVIRGGAGEGPTVAVRADMDALPVTEETGLPFASEHPGRMHACGHDGHMSIALGAAKILAGMRSGLKGNVLFLFQPAEETVGGAEGMITDGALASPKADLIVGLHIWPGFDSGVFAVKPGPVMASVDRFEIDFIGRGGHGAMPHLCVDPVVMASEAVLSFQRIVSREVDPLEPVVLTVGKIEGGTTFNVIPEKVTLTGTVRTLNEDVRAFVRRRMDEIAAGIAGSCRGSRRFGWEPGVPPAVNDAGLTRRIERILKNSFGPDRVVTDFRPSMGGEDFALYQREIPGVYFFLGTRNPDKDCVYPLHHSRYRFDEDVIPLGVRAFCEIVLDHLA